MAAQSTSDRVRSVRLALAALALLMVGNGPAGDTPTASDYLDDARSLDAIIAENYAYLDRFGDVMPQSAVLDAERDAVRDKKTLLHYAERRLASLADHHAITGSSFGDSWALVPSYADLWVVQGENGWAIDAVRAGSPAEAAGIAADDLVVAVDGVPIDQAIAGFRTALGLGASDDPDVLGYAARVLAAGRRDQERVLKIAGKAGPRELHLPNLYQLSRPDRDPVSVTRAGGGTVTIRFNDSLGDDATVAAFDAAMRALPEGTKLVLDLTDTASGGNSTVARGIMGWFVDEPRFYQKHRLVSEERATGIVRQWVEQVLPRKDMHFAGPVEVHVGRWTGSMGEGMAIGFDAIGIAVCGHRMAGLRGAVYDFVAPASGLTAKLPAEKLFSPDGVPREDFVPASCTS